MPTLMHHLTQRAAAKAWKDAAYDALYSGRRFYMIH